MFDKTKAYATIDEIDEAWWREHRASDGCSRYEMLRDLLKGILHREFRHGELGWNAHLVLVELEDTYWSDIANGKPPADEFEEIDVDLAVYQVFRRDIENEGMLGVNIDRIMNTFAEWPLDQFHKTTRDLHIPNLSITKEGFVWWLKAHRLELPKFWFGGDTDNNPAEADPYRTGSPGRPTAKNFVEKEFERRVKAGVAKKKLKDEAEDLLCWLADDHPRAPSVRAKTIENIIRDKHRLAFPSTGYGQRH